jgi:hypothetical protein
VGRKLDVARPYSEKFLLELTKADPNSLGVQLGRLCIDSNIPATYVAFALEVSRVTVYSWFRGQGVREGTRKRVEAFISILEKDLKEEILPAKTIFDAKLYIESITGGRI